MNPILPTPDAADPHIELVGDRYYVYATNAGVWQHTDAFHRGDASQHGHAFVAWSSSDLVQWRNEGVILGFGDVDWARGLKDAWAPCLATRNGRCYFYFCAQSRIGVAVGDGPAGPFRDALGEPLVPFEPDLNSIDPMVFTDDDGQAYLYWGAVPASWLHGQVETIYSNLWVAKLNPDMVSFDGPAVATLETPPNPKGHNGYGPHIEASHVIKRDGVYYLMYSTGQLERRGRFGLSRSHRDGAASARPLDKTGRAGVGVASRTRYFGAGPPFDVAVARHRQLADLLSLP